MSRADELRSQYERKIAKVGQWIAIRRYGGTGGTRTYADTAAKAYVLYETSKEFVGTSMQADLKAIALVDTLAAILPVSTNDRIVTAFFGNDDLSVPPALDGSGHISGGKESAIHAAIKRAPGGVLIAVEIHAVG